MDEKVLAHSSPPENPRTAERLPSGTSAARRQFFVRAVQSIAAAAECNRLLVRVLTVLGSILGVSASYAGVRFLWPRSPQRADDWIPVAPVDQIIPDSVQTAWLNTLGVYVVRQSEEQGERIVVLKASCTHLGCMTQWDAGLRQFVCPCHGSAFGKEGHRLRGPARRALERCAVDLVDGILLVNTRLTFRRENGGWDDPRSFVIVERAVG
ncbi:ubiquinol-cytochrome c reductase iron-sulfur subunit [Thermogutta sp.]|uniref:QcrA and Rieske domain-containing protein n=1 Tax=Thermogutta sp. TaxID=1962930 RepID=UPI0032209559